MEGTLSKWTNVMKGWQYRYFVLDDNAGLFSYYTSRDKMVRGSRRGCVRLKGALIGIDDEDDATFTITVDGKTFHFQAKDSEEREQWIRALEDTVVRHNQIRRSYKSRDRVAIMGDSPNPPNMADFDKKLAETDSYLQLLLNQVSGLKAKMEPNDGGDNGRMPEEDKRSRCEDIACKAISMTESIKHAIVLLQIAKNSAVPPADHGVKSFKTESPPTRSVDNLTCHSYSLQGSCDSSVDSPIRRPGDNAAAQIEICKEVNEVLTVPIQDIPAVSYSSSEDEYFDADSESGCDQGSKPPPSTLLVLDDQVIIPDLQSPMTPTMDENDEEIDFDSLYEDTPQEETVDMKSHGSVISHLLSQVRIGMDLTKIVLPTFILERRSLLEMYSDFFAHPDLFVSIADGQTPEERMILVLKWYLSSFHAGRKSTIAKKPYNPIIGETFRCHWDLKQSEDSASQSQSDEQDLSRIAKESQLPWCSSDDLTFVAEQVSHHPPVSAFYAEHIKKKISVNAHIYTKSSFLGMSVAVHNVGKGAVTLLNHGEEYVATFPSGFCRSILTVPWVELGGKVGINCAKTGYSAAIEFKCKQFFSSDCNKVTAEVFAPNSKKALLKVDGEWNGRMTAKWASGKSEFFVDVNKLPIHKKHCKLIAEQKRFESRRLWKNVTYNLKVNKIEAATAAKFALEQRQREEAAQRKAAGTQWQTTLFDQDDVTKPITGDTTWEYREPLSQRFQKHESK